MVPLHFRQGFKDRNVEKKNNIPSFETATRGCFETATSKVVTSPVLWKDIKILAVNRNTAICGFEGDLKQQLNASLTECLPLRTGWGWLWQRGSNWRTVLKEARDLAGL